MPLTWFDCRGNAVCDLTPITGMNLRMLYCGNNPLTSLLPLTGMPIEDLEIEGIPLTPDNVQVNATCR